MQDKSDNMICLKKKKFQTSGKNLSEIVNQSLETKKKPQSYSKERAGTKRKL